MIKAKGNTAQTPKLLQVQRRLPPQRCLNHTVCRLCLSVLAKRNTLHAFFLLQGPSTNLHPTFKDEEALYCIPPAYRSPQKLASQIIGELRQTHRIPMGSHVRMSVREINAREISISQQRQLQPFGVQLCSNGNPEIQMLVQTPCLFKPASEFSVVRVNLESHLSAYPCPRILDLRNKGEYGGKPVIP